MDKERPVLTGIVALAGVGLVVGLLVSAAAVVATQGLGLGGESASAGTSRVGAQQSMILPTPVATSAPTGPLLTLAPDPEDRATDGLASSAPSAPPTPASAISLSASTTQARPGEEVTLAGTYPSGEGATLAVERLTGGSWASFADVTTTVSGATFSTYIRTSQIGKSTFRVRDTRTDLASNEVKFTIG